MANNEFAGFNRSLYQKFIINAILSLLIHSYCSVIMNIVNIKILIEQIFKVLITH